MSLSRVLGRAVLGGSAALAGFGAGLVFAQEPAVAPKAGEAKAGEAKAGEAKAGEAKAGEAKAGEAAPAQGAEPKAGETPDDKYYDLFREFVDTFEQIDRNYVKEVDRKKLMQAAIQGMLTELDPYSSYIPQEELADFTQGIEQEFGGVGIQVQIDPETRRLTVVTPLPGTPAYRAGVLAGDVIMEVEGQSTEGYTVEDAVKKLKGKPGEEVEIGVLHKGSESVEKLKLTREVIQVATVLGDKYEKDGAWDFMLDDANKIGYVRLTHFSRRTGEELRDALEKLQAEGMKGLVLDLRFNPGGLLSEAVEVCDLFLDHGTIVSTKGRNVPERSWEAHEPGSFTGFPMAVLVNRYSASASEIVSACLQDNGRAVVVGERTWGKGSVQNVIDVAGGASALKLTTASYMRPNGHNIHRFPDMKESDEWGVKPNDGFEARFSDDELRTYLLNRRSRDVIGSDVKPAEDKQLDKALGYVREKVAGKPAEAEKKEGGAKAGGVLPRRAAA